VPVAGKTGNSVSFGTDGDWWMVTATQCTECNTVSYWAATPVSTEQWALSTDLSATQCVTEQWLQWALNSEHWAQTWLRYWAETPVSTEQWALSTDLSANCKLWMRNLNRIINKVQPRFGRMLKRGRAEAFGRTFGQCSALTELPKFSIREWKGGKWMGRKK